MPIAVEAVRPGTRPKSSFAPTRNFHRKWRGHARFAPAITQSHAQIERLKIIRLFKVRVRPAGVFEKMCARRQLRHTVQWNFRVRIKTMIDTDRSLGAVAVERFIFQISSST